MKNVVITGSTRGIGFYMALEFLRAGSNVILSGRGEALSKEALAELSPFEGKYDYMQCNVQDKAALQNLWDLSFAKWGKIDIWINNAGRNMPHEVTWEIDETCVENIIQTNLIGMVYGSQIAAKEMIKQGYGAIYSMEGLGSNNMIQPKTILYGTTKHALSYFMKGLAKELDGTGVIAGRLSPGMMLTDFITKTSDGEQSKVIADKKFRKVFNILADKPDVVAKFFVPAMLKNTKNDSQIAWLSTAKVAWRFLTAGFRKDRLI